ncbi:histidine phosphatase superfamily [Tricharina praecox]|uniref:histidine phosphatase superfamily n=1 Tax=Tricharina praecox TaxID=43433 RepID=UPI00221F3717|nr:histidine phosphatase superfamily [Tricharina praecox]KAI5849107.1 histidine phosphatase superfamily [Tricharina praecox]
MLRSIAVLLLAAELAAAHADTVKGAVIFSRHGDRTWKGAPPTTLTAVGQQQLYNSSTYWRSRWLDSVSGYQIVNLSEDVYNSAQFSAATPDQPLLVTSGQVFLQGLYPPLNETSEHPLSGYQYVPLATIPSDSPASIWLKGDDGCPAYDDLADRWNSTAEFKALEASTKDFYLSFYDNIFAGVLPKSKLSYSNAYNIFDYVNVGMVHNKTISNSISQEELFQLRTLADSAEWAKAGAISSANDPLAVSGLTFSSKVLQQLQAIVDSKGTKNLLNVNIGSYDTMLSFFALAGLPSVNANFYGLPDYASTLAFELYSHTDAFPGDLSELKVRFLFRNGTDAPAESFRLFDSSTAALSWADFKAGMEKISLKSVEEWCAFCSSTEDYCLPYKQETRAVTKEVAGVIGAVVTLGVLIVAAVVAAVAGVRISRRTKLGSVAVIAGGKQFDEASSYAGSKL